VKKLTIRRRRRFRRNTDPRVREELMLIVEHRCQGSLTTP
jgi:hypothetical protein